MERPQSSQDKNDPQKVRSETEDLFLTLVNEYQDAIFRFLYFRVGNRATAVDITQDTFTKTWKYLVSGKTIEYPEAFLYRAAKNALIDFYKKEKTGSLDTLLESGYDPGSTRDTDEVLKNDDIESIRALLETLDEDSRQIIYLRYTEEKSIEEIATIYGKTTNAMTVYIHRIIQKLRTKHNESQS